MRIVTPDYYKNFKCIAGVCEDTCCAGWEVDVDEDKYRYYRTVGGELGERLKSVIIPKRKGEGCSFRLTEDKLCPFLNERNLCDIITELGEDAICETCTYFPRFVHDYGSFREIGPAPSCFTAAQLMVKKQNRTQLETTEDTSIFITPNDIDPDAFFLLQDFRNNCFDMLWGREPLPEKLITILNNAGDAQSELAELLEISVSERDTKGKCNDLVSLWLAPFEGMEVINTDWTHILKVHDEFCGEHPTTDDKCRVYAIFDEKTPIAEAAFTQLVFYFFFRYILESVHDGRLMCAVKTGVVAYICIKRLCVSLFHKNGSITDDEIADVFHLYSRQVEHSEVNFGYYREAYDSAWEYDEGEIIKILRSYAPKDDGENI